MTPEVVMNIAFLGMFRIISNPAVSQQPQLGKKTTVLGKEDLCGSALTSGKPI